MSSNVMRKEPNLRLIEGGLVSKEQADKEFVSAFATDTRLMGQIAMGIHWRVIDHPDAEDLYQFFSFDTEESGLDNYKSVWNGDSDEISLIRQTMIGPLGGDDVRISEKEAKALFTKYYSMNRKKRIEFETGIQEYRFLINDPVYLDKVEYDDLFSRLCTNIVSNEQLVNYYIMRSLAKDTEGKRYLSSTDHMTENYIKESKERSEEDLVNHSTESSDSGFDEDLFSDIPLVTLLKNTIHENDGHYISRSLVEYGGRYELLSTDITIENEKVATCTRISGLKITSTEAALMLARPEFITVYRIMADPEEFEAHPLEFDYNTMITDHDNGRMYMAFNSNNDHVNDANYMLSNDIFGVYYITRFGEFVVSAGSKENIIKLERSLLHSPVGPLLLPTGKFEFQEPVLLQFVNSDYDEFNDFLLAITDHDQ